MFDSITADTVFSDLVMQRTQDERAFLVVEGESDCRLLDQHLAQEECLIIIAYGRENALGAMKLAHEEREALIQPTAALVDADYGLVADGRLSLPNVIVTDLNDLDAEVVSVSGLATRIGVTHVQGPALRKLLKQHSHEDLLSAAKKIVRPISSLKYMSRINGAEIAISDMPILAIYNKSDVELDLSKLARIARSRLSESELSRFGHQIEAWLACDEAIDLTNYHNGHQLIAAMHAVLRKNLNYPAKVDNIENAIRVAVGFAELFSIACIDRLTAWFEQAGVWIWQTDRDIARAS